MKFKKFLKYLFFLVLIISLGLLYSFSHKRNLALKIGNPVVEFDNAINIKNDLSFLGSGNKYHDMIRENMEKYEKTKTPLPHICQSVPGGEKELLREKGLNLEGGSPL